MISVKLKRQIWNCFSKGKELICAVYLLIFLTSLTGCDKDEINVLTVTPANIDFEANGGSAGMQINTDAKSWDITNPASDWVNVSSTAGTLNNATVTISVSSRTLEARSATLVINAGNSHPVEVALSQAASDFLYTVTSDVSELNFKQTGEVKSFTITTNGPQWSLGVIVQWLKFAPSATKEGTIDVTALPNTTKEERSTQISIITEHAATVYISVHQQASLYPNYNTSPITPDATGMTSNALQLAAKIKLGWNLGNTLEAIGGETAWGNPKTSKALIDLIKANGFNAVRLPCSWNQYANSTTAEISAQWLDRVKEVVQYCVDNDLYVLLNIHWDSGWLDGNINADKQEDTKAKQKAFWEQIATKMRDFDEHLMFASANEPPVNNATEMSILLSYHQTFVDAVRSTGGHNSYRVLVIQGPSTDIDKTTALMNTMPTDQVAGRMMAEVHYYGPWQFCGLTEDADWGKIFHYWGNGYHSTTDPTRNATWGEEGYVAEVFQKIKMKFADTGIPVVLGEYGAIRRPTALTGDALTLHLASRAYWNKYITQQAIAHGLLPFYWDEGSIINHGFGIFNRQNNTVFDQQVLDVLIEGAQ